MKLIPGPDPAVLRAAMMTSLREQGLLHSERVAAALATAPQHAFAPGEHADHFRGGAARIVYYPADADITGLAGWRSVKRHGVLAISWT